MGCWHGAPERGLPAPVRLSGGGESGLASRIDLGSSPFPSIHSLRAPGGPLLLSMPMKWAWLYFPHCSEHSSGPCCWTLQLP